jgi:hypothetical protein
MSAAVIAFPSVAFGAAEYAELRRWDAAAYAAERFCVHDGDRPGQWTDHTVAGLPCVGITRGDPTNAALFQVVPSQGGWALIDCWGWTLAGTFRTLRDALETVCVTLPKAAA